MPGDVQMVIYGEIDVMLLYVLTRITPGDVNNCEEISTNALSISDKKETR